MEGGGDEPQIGTFIPCQIGNSALKMIMLKHKLKKKDKKCLHGNQMIIKDVYEGFKNYPVRLGSLVLFCFIHPDLFNFEFDQR